MKKLNDRDWFGREQPARLRSEPLSPVQNRLAQLSLADRDSTRKPQKYPFPFGWMSLARFKKHTCRNSGRDLQRIESP